MTALWKPMKASMARLCEHKLSTLQSDRHPRGKRDQALSAWEIDQPEFSGRSTSANDLHRPRRSYVLEVMGMILMRSQETSCEARRDLCGGIHQEPRPAVTRFQHQLRRIYRRNAPRSAEIAASRELGKAQRQSLRHPTRFSRWRLKSRLWAVNFDTFVRSYFSLSTFSIRRK